MSFRAWLSVITFGLIAVILFFSRHELVKAWELLGKVNLWVLILLLPMQLVVYYTAGEMLFSYLRAKSSISHVSRLALVRVALEMNFVNHALPSGGVSGISYMSWRLGTFGVSPGRATMASVVRFAVGFMAFIVLVTVAVIVVTIDGNINRWIILVSSALVGIMVGALLAGIFLVSSKRRMEKFGAWLVRATNGLVRRLSLGKRRVVLHNETVMGFMEEMHHDYLALRADKRLLVKPFWWGIVYTCADAALFWVAFVALGQPVNPAPILIAYGLASVAGFIVVTPGGAGAYEAIMVAILSVAGIAQNTAIAGILLTRVVVLLCTIGFGYVFYQHALIRYGKKQGGA